MEKPQKDEFTNKMELNVRKKRILKAKQSPGNKMENRGMKETAQYNEMNNYCIINDRLELMKKVTLKIKGVSAQRIVHI